MQTNLDFETPADATGEQLGEFLGSLEDKLEAAMEQATLMVQADAARGAPVDTGRLRSSIESNVERVADAVLRGEVGSNVEYAIRQEIEQRYLREAFEDNADAIIELFETAIEEAAQEAGLT